MVDYEVCDDWSCLPRFQTHDATDGARLLLTATIFPPHAGQFDEFGKDVIEWSQFLDQIRYVHPWFDGSRIQRGTSKVGDYLVKGTERRISSKPDSISQSRKMISASMTGVHVITD